MPRFKIGQKVVALVTHDFGRFKRDDVLIVDGLTSCRRCGQDAIYLQGLNKITHLEHAICGYLSETPEREFFASVNFAPLSPIREKIKYSFNVNIPKPEIIEREQLIPLKELINNN